MDLVKIVVTVPLTHADAVRLGMGAAGGGHLGAYSACSYSVSGTGRFTPETGASPFIGALGVAEHVLEERIEVTCQRDRARAVIAAARACHPYEEAVIDVYALLDPDDLP